MILSFDCGCFYDNNEKPNGELVLCEKHWQEKLSYDNEKKGRPKLSERM